MEAIALNPTVEEADKPRISKQAQQIYDRLLAGAVLNTDLAKIALQYNARIYEIRKHLAGSGKTVEIIERLDGGVNRYAIVGVYS